MPITFEIDRTRKTVFARAAGVITKEEFFGYQEELQAAPELRHFDECIDLSAVSEFQGATDRNMVSMAKLAAQMDDPAQPTRLAIIAHSDLHYGLARMYETFRSMQPGNSREVSVFRSPEEALRWLTREEETAP